MRRRFNFGHWRPGSWCWQTAHFVTEITIWSNRHTLGRKSGFPGYNLQFSKIPSREEFNDRIYWAWSDFRHLPTASAWMQFANWEFWCQFPTRQFGISQYARLQLCPPVFVKISVFHSKINHDSISCRLFRDSKSYNYKDRPKWYVTTLKPGKYNCATLGVHFAGFQEVTISRRISWERQIRLQGVQ
jgi:hypothetical protein